MQPFNVFDANCMLGRHLKLQAGAPHTVDHLLEDMDHFGIAEALVLDCMSKENHPKEGNQRILSVTAPHARLHPAWVGLPPGTPDEQPDPEAFVEEMRTNRVGALFLFPRLFRFDLKDWIVDALLEPLSAAGAPLFVNYKHDGRDWWPPDETDWDEVVALCRRWPELPVVVSESRFRQANRMIYRALDTCPNLRIELSGYWLHHGVEYITERWGADRLLFGSNWPHFGHGSTLATLTLADIDDKSKQRIAGDNLRDLVAWCEPDHPTVASTEPADEYVAYGRTGQRLEDMTFADCHGHLGLSRNYHIPNGTVPEMIAEMDRLGVEKVCAFSLSVARTDEQFGNDYVAEAMRAFPGRFVGLTGLNPHHGADEMVRELERCHELGFRGIKLISDSYGGYPSNGPLVDVACKWVHDHKQIILNHSWGSPENMERLVATYPDACFFTGHTTPAYADIMRHYPNLYVCSCPLCGPGDCEYYVDLIGADRLLFGSDLSDLPIAWGLGPILFARISVEDKQRILGGNLRGILERYSLPA